MSTKVVSGVTDEFDEEMFTVLFKPAPPFSPDMPGDELEDHLLFTVWHTGESLFQSVDDRVSPEGPGTGVCLPDVERGPLNINLGRDSRDRESLVRDFGDRECRDLEFGEEDSDLERDGPYSFVRLLSIFSPRVLRLQ